MSHRGTSISVWLTLGALIWPGAIALAYPSTPRSYTLPSQQSETLPAALPPGPVSSFSKDLDLPDADHYLVEVLRAMRGGFFPATVAQLAVVKDGAPVQALLIETQGHAPWHVTSRKLGSVPWERFVALRKQFLEALAANARSGPPALWRDGGLAVCTDDGTGMVEYSNPNGLSARLSKCEDGSTIEIENEIITTVRAAVSGS